MVRMRSIPVMEKKVSARLEADQEAAWRAFLKAHALLTRQLDRDLRDCCQMTLVTYDALVQLNEAPQRQLRISELADALVHSRSGLTRIVDNLEKAGHIRRERDQSDRRAWIITLTPHGVASLRTAWRTHVQGIVRHFASYLTDTQARTVTKTFRAIAADLAPDQLGLTTSQRKDAS